MSNLIVIGFDNEHKAFELRTKLVKLRIRSRVYYEIDKLGKTIDDL
jgi:uncharacterized membrane protein